MNRTSPASRRPLERGQFSWVSLLLLVVFVSTAYLAVVWVPVYILHYEVKQTVRDFMNRAVKNPNDEALVSQLCLRLAALDSTVEIGEDGQKTTGPTVVVEPRDVTWERDATSTPRTLHVAFDYVRVVKYPLLDRSEERVMSIDFTEDISIPVWGN
jgi:maltodextrin utilization protein YvdJ